jgi:uncharacterized protein
VASDRTEEATLIERARAWVGAPPGEDKVARDPVNRAMIHHWVQALEDHNPVYVDDELASRTRHRGVIAPPGMLQTWTMDAPQKDPQGPASQVMASLDAAGYTSVVATDYEHDYRRQLRPGDHLTQRTVVEDLGDEKRTALGPGRFFTVRHDYVDQDGEVVGVGRMRMLKFKPPAAPESPPEDDAPADRELPRRPRPAVNRDNAYFWEGVQVGELRLQRCLGCQRLRHPPRPMCDACRVTAWDHVVAAGTGRIHSFVVHHHPPLPGVTLPHPVLLVDLDEGVRIIAEATEGTDPAQLEIGAAVVLEFKDVDQDLTVPAFRPVGRTDDEQRQEGTGR